MDGYQVFIMVMGFLVISPTLAGDFTRWGIHFIQYALIACQKPGALHPGDKRNDSSTDVRLPFRTLA